LNLPRKCKRPPTHPPEPGYPCYVSVLGELAWMAPRGEPFTSLQGGRDGSRHARLVSTSSTRFVPSHEDAQWLFEDALQVAQERGTGCAVHGAVVDGEGDFHLLHLHQFAVAQHGHRARRTAREDSGLRRVEHGGELVDAEHAQVAD